MVSVITRVYCSSSLLDGLHVPQAIIKVVAVLDGHTLVDLLYLRGRQSRDAHTQSVVLALSHDGHHALGRRGRGHLGPLGGEAWTHNVGPTEDKSYGPPVYLHPRQHEWVCKILMGLSELFSERENTKIHTLYRYIFTYTAYTHIEIERQREINVTDLKGENRSLP